jgi:hypothetical protein
MTVGGVGGGGSAGPDLALEQLRRDNALLNTVHDPAEDEPHIVGIPKRFLIPDGEPTTPPHS